MKQKLSLIVLSYLRILAKIQLTKISWLQLIKRQPLTIVGITGSAGKTSTMLATETILAPFFKVKTNHGANSESGIPLNILDLKIESFSYLDWLRVILLAPLQVLLNWKPYQIYLVEMGIDGPDEPKNMSYLLKVIQPQVAVLLGVNPVHSQQFDTTVPLHVKGNPRLSQILTNIAREKARLITQNPRLTTAIINIDDNYTNQLIPSLSSCRLITLGKDPQATFQTVNSSCGPQGFKATYKVNNKKYILSLPNQILPRIYHISFAAALAIAQALNVSPELAISKLSTFTPPYSRSSLFKGINNSQIIDSTYNSSPGTAEEMLSLLAKFPPPRIAVLGDMRELGKQSDLAHKSLYREALKISDLVISVGPLTKKYFGLKAVKFTYWWQAADYLHVNLPPKASVLVKGSQNTIFLEEIVKTLLLNPGDNRLICRQSPSWLKVKTNFANSLGFSTTQSG